MLLQKQRRRECCRCMASLPNGQARCRRLMRWLDSTPAPPSMQSQKGMQRSNTIGRGVEIVNELSLPQGWSDVTARAGHAAQWGTTLRIPDGRSAVDRRRQNVRFGPARAPPRPLTLPLHLPSASCSGQQLGWGTFKTASNWLCWRV